MGEFVPALKISPINLSCFLASCTPISKYKSATSSENIKSLVIDPSPLGSNFEYLRADLIPSGIRAEKLSWPGP